MNLSVNSIKIPGIKLSRSQREDDGDEQFDIAAKLDGIVGYYSDRFPESRFTLLPDGTLLAPSSNSNRNARMLAAMRHEVRAVNGRCRLEILPAAVYEAETQITTHVAIDDEGSTEALNEQMLEILNTAIARDASDTYIDVHPTRALISYRVNGIKQPNEGYLSPEQGFSICRAIWARANESFEERQTCDCSFTFNAMRFRGNSLPTFNGGCGVVLRMRDPTFHLPLEVCGYSNEQIDAIKAVCQSPGGLVLLTGETNSGKSSTMATLMSMLPSTMKTVEISDPVEVVMEHITQVSIPRHAEDSERRFKGTLAGLVRQNPDTLVLGEIRDTDTSEAAMQMALQGKRVISTLHTQSCILAFARLGDLGMDETLIYKAGFISGVINQNLVPTICEECRLPEPPDADVRKELGDRHRKMFKGAARYASGISCGKDKCRGGVIGQTLVAEVFPMCYDRDGAVIEMLRENNTKDALNRVCKDWHMEAKHQHAWRKVVAGICDPLQVENIIGRFTPDSDCPSDLS